MFLPSISQWLNFSANIPTYIPLEQNFHLLVSIRSKISTMIVGPQTFEFEFLHQPLSFSVSWSFATVSAHFPQVLLVPLPVTRSDRPAPTEFHSWVLSLPPKSSSPRTRSLCERSRSWFQLSDSVRKLRNHLLVFHSCRLLVNVLQDFQCSVRRLRSRLLLFHVHVRINRLSSFLSRFREE